MTSDALETLRSMWVGYRDVMVPASAPPTKVIETRRAFYAGTWSILCALEKLSADTLTEAEAMAYLQSLSDEFRRFKDSIGTPLEGRE